MKTRLPAAAFVVLSAVTACAPPVADEPLEAITSSLDVPAPPDIDHDGVPDALDCDPQSSRLGAIIALDDLSTATGVIAAATGFSTKAWRYEDGAYRQDEADLGADAALFTAMQNGDGDADAKVTASITDGESADGKVLLLAGASDDAGDLAAYGCGVAVWDGWAEATIVKLSGSQGAVRTHTVEVGDLDDFDLDSDFDVEVRTDGGTLTCTITQGGSTTTIEADVDPEAGGAVGLYTQDLAAAFRDARICAVSSGIETPTTPAGADN